MSTWSRPRCASPPGRPWPTSACPGQSSCAVPRCSAASPPRTPPTGSAPTPARSPTYRSPAAPVSASTAARSTPAPDQPALRLDAGQAHLPRPRLPRRGRSGPARPGRVPHPRRLDQHPVPAGRARRPGLRRRRREHRRSSTSARSCCAAAVEGPRHQDAELARRRHGQQAQRRAPGHDRPGREAPGASTSPQPPPGRLAPAPARARPGRASPRALRAQTAARRHRHHLPRRAPVAARDPRAHPGPASRSRPTSPG